MIVMIIVVAIIINKWILRDRIIIIGKLFNGLLRINLYQ
jgi:hypothetical protein